MEIIHHHFETIDSTNTWGKQHAHEFSRDKITLVTADGQTAGRGRFKRKWESPPGQNIYASFCFFVEKHRVDIGNLPQLLALSACDVLESLGFQPQLKWPNDIVLSKKKVAGILAETTPLSDQLCVVLGIGININMPEELLNKIDRPATSLLVEGKKPYEIINVLKALQSKFQKDLELFFSEGFYPFLGKYRKKMYTGPHELIRFNDNRTVWEGYFEQVNDDGSFTMKLLNGESKRFIVGEILWPNTKF